MHYNSIIVVIIVKMIFLCSFLLCCLLYNHSFKTNPNSTTNLSKLCQLTFAHCVRLFLYTFFKVAMVCQSETLSVDVGGKIKSIHQRLHEQQNCDGLEFKRRERWRQKFSQQFELHDQFKCEGKKKCQTNDGNERIDGIKKDFQKFAACQVSI